MDERIKECVDLTERDVDLLYMIEAGLAIAADVSRSDVLLCAMLPNGGALVLNHVEPHSISSLHRQNITGRTLTAETQPALIRSLRTGGRSRHKREVISSGAPASQRITVIHNASGKVIAALLIETNMIEAERQRRRDRHFRRAIYWLQEMAARGEIENPGELRRFRPYDGVYVVGRNRHLIYMSGVATNHFRSIGHQQDTRGKDVSKLEEVDAILVDQAFDAHRCAEIRQESEDGRVWVRGVIPLTMPSSFWDSYLLHGGWFGNSRIGSMLLNSPPMLLLQNKNNSNLLSSSLGSVFDRLVLKRIHALWFGDSSHTHPSNRSGQSIDGAIVLVHNATSTVQQARELNVKSAIIQEVHHRVKNNLQTIAALLRIQARRVEDEDSAQHLTDAVNRILSMSVIHEFLSQDEHQPINIRDVCQRIANQVAQVVSNPDQEIDIRVTGPNIRLPAGQATPTAMIINELLLNAMEHGLHDKAHGQIEIQLTDLGDAVKISILDDGNGLPVDFNASEINSLGLQIVKTLIYDDLKGTLSIQPVVYSVASAHERPNRTSNPNGAAEDGVTTDDVTTGDIIADDVTTDDVTTIMPDNSANGFITAAVVEFPKRSVAAEK